MKKLHTFLATLCLTIGFSNAQTPQAINYQGVARDASGNEYANTNIGIRISIKDVSALGSIIYEETHNVTTNQFGLFALEIGNGTATIGTFSAIDWSTNSKWLDVGMDVNGGTAYTNMGTSQLVSVPYALYAENSGDGGSVWSENGNDAFYNTGNVGIGTNSPVGIMEITGTVSNPGDPLLQLSDASTTNGRIRLRDGGGSANNFSPTIDGHAEGSDSQFGLGLISWSAQDNDPNDKGMLFRSRSSDGSSLTTSPTYTWVNGPSDTEFQMQLSADGNLGIGVTATEKLDVNGNVKSTGFIMPTGAQNNYVLTSDATGISSWTDPSTLGLTAIWSQNGSDAFYNTGNVGIGTNSPNANLNISSAASTSSEPFIEMNDATTPSGFLRFRDLTDIANQFNPTIEGESFGVQLDRSGLNIIGRLANDAAGSRGMLFQVKSSNDTRLVNAATFIWRHDQDEIMRIDANDNLGIGTTTPKAKLEVVGNTYVGDELSGAGNTSILTDPKLNVNRNSVSLSSEANILQLTAHTSADGSSGDAGTLLMGTTNVPGARSVFFSSNDETTSGIGFKTRNTSGEDYRMVIDADGNIGIGSIAPTAQLNISGVATNPGIPFIEMNDESAPDGFIMFRDATGLTNQFAPMLDARGTGTGVTRSGLQLVGRVGDDGTDDIGIVFRSWANQNDIISNASLFEWQSGTNIMMDMNANGNLGIGTDVANSKVHVANGDVYLDNSNNGIILTSPNGSCFRVTVDNAGTLTPTAITCP